MDASGNQSKQSFEMGLVCVCETWGQSDSTDFAAWIENVSQKLWSHQPKRDVPGKPSIWKFLMCIVMTSKRLGMHKYVVCDSVHIKQGGQQT